MLFVFHQNVDAALYNNFPPFCARRLCRVTSSQGRHLYAARPATPACSNVWITSRCVGSDIKQNKEWGKLPHLWLWEHARHTYSGAWWGNSACCAAWLSSDCTPVFLCVATFQVRQSFATMFLICCLDGVIRTLKFHSESRTTPAFHVGDTQGAVWCFLCQQNYFTVLRTGKRNISTLARQHYWL